MSQSAKYKPKARAITRKLIRSRLNRILDPLVKTKRGYDDIVRIS